MDYSPGVIVSIIIDSEEIRQSSRLFCSAAHLSSVNHNLRRVKGADDGNAPIISQLSQTYAIGYRKVRASSCGVSEGQRLIAPHPSPTALSNRRPPPPGIPHQINRRLRGLPGRREASSPAGDIKHSFSGGEADRKVLDGLTYRSCDKSMLLGNPRGTHERTAPCVFFS